MCFFNNLTVLDDIDDWCERYDLVRKQFPCRICGEMLDLEIPFASDNVRGIKSKVCDCGNEKTPFSYIIVDLDKWL